MNESGISAGGLEALRSRVARDAALAERLYAVPSDRFVAEAVAEALRLGLDVGEDALRAAIDAGRRAWMMRWIA